MMRGRLMEEMAALEFNNSAMQQQLERFHFASLPMTGVSDVRANWIPYLMGHWQSPKKVIRAHGAGKPPGLRASLTYLHTSRQALGGLSLSCVQHRAVQHLG